MPSPAISVVLPAYDEALHLADNLRRLVAYLDGHAPPFEVVVVDDGSRDGTEAAARSVAAGDPRVRVIVHPRNRGKGAALATGCAAALGEVVVLLDADLEIPPEEILPLLDLMKAEGADVAVGSKYHPRSHLVWPWRRRILSRLYHFVTAILFRLPLRDTQTGLKALRRDVARQLVPKLTAQRFAWDVELILLAHETGRKAVAGPVRIEPASRASRVTPRAFLHAGLDTLRIFVRHRTLGAYALRARPRPPTRVHANGDDLGMSPAVDEGLLRGLETGGLTSVSALATAPRLEAAVAATLRRVPGASVGLHLDLLKGGSLAGWTLRALFGLRAAGEVEAEVAAQVARLRSLGVAPAHLDAHRHAWLVPVVRRAVCRAAARAGIRRVRPLRPLGPLFASGPVEGLKRLVLLAASVLCAGIPRAYGLDCPDGHVDARAAARWIRRGRLPRFALGRTIEVIAHPLHGASDLPPSEERTLDRPAETRAVLDPPLAPALAALGGVPARAS